ncbi:hypothetical protein [Parasutterella sp.]|uniref:hypothetical protein n=1 Tax=Parasutterella sp. TaxID=2049037 RepID=UPI00351FCA58
MKDEKFTFTKREIHQFLEKRRLAHDAVLAMVSSGAIKLPCADFSRLKGDDADEKREPTKIASLNVAVIESLINHTHEYLCTQSMSKRYSTLPATIFECFGEDPEVFEKGPEAERFAFLQNWLVEGADISSIERGKPVD